MASRRERGPRGPPSNAGGKGFQGFQNPFNRGKNEGSGRLRLSRNALRQDLVREGRNKFGYDAVSTRIEDKQVDNWGAMFEFDPDLAEAFDKNMRFFKHMFSVDNILAPLPTPLRKSLSHNFGFFTRVFTQFVDRRETRNLRASIPGLAQLQELADETEIERAKKMRQLQMEAMAEAEGGKKKKKVKELK